MVWLRTTLVAAAFVGTMFVGLPRWILAATGQPAMVTGWPRLVGLVFLGAGITVMVWCWGVFGVHGRGTPAPFDPPRQLVVRGPYRYIRNPMYVAGILVLLGQAVLFASLPLLAYAAAFWLAAQLFVLGYEERTLTRRFGSDYAGYCASVRRWVPHRLRPPSNYHTPAS